MDVDVAAYLERIRFPGVPEVDLGSLAALQRSHLGAVPFENLYVFHRLDVGVDPSWSVPKVLGGRGGWCFELNGAFATLLRALGYRVDTLGASVLLGPEPPPEPDHTTLLVHLDRPYLVDVGFGESVTRPLPLDSTDPVREDHGSYRLVPIDPGRYALEFRDDREPDATPDWVRHFEFDLRPREMGSFTGRSRYLATEPGLAWTTSPFATRLIPAGRVTLLKDRLKFRRAGVLTDEPVAPDEWADMLRRWFDMAPPA